MRYSVIVMTESGWLPDLLYTGAEFVSGVAMMVNEGGRITRFSRAPADCKAARRLPGRAMLPGLINVHSHAFQRAIRGRTEHRTSDRDTFWTWREAMYRAANRISPEQMFAIARLAFLEMALSGITTVGEFHYVHHGPGGAAYADRNLLARKMIRAAEEIGIRIALLRVAYVRAGWKKAPDAGQARFLTPRIEDFVANTDALRRAFRSEMAWVGVAPHSLRAVPIEYLREVASYARHNALRLHMHVAEQPAEVEASLGEYGRRPVEMLHQEGIVDSRFTAIHAIHIGADEMRLLRGASVCACPTSERNLGDGAVPADGLYNAGAAICFGSDSNIQIDLLEDARLLEYDLRMNRLERCVLCDASGEQVLARRLFHSATVSGAASLGAPGGELEPGRPADFFTVDLSDPSIAGADAGSLLNQIVFALERTAVREVGVNGKLIVCDGRHPLQEEIGNQFAAVQRDLWK